MKFGQQEIESEPSVTSNYAVDDQVAVPENISFLATAQFWILVFVLLGIGAVLYILISKKKQKQQEIEQQQFTGVQVHDGRSEKVVVE